MGATSQRMDPPQTRQMLPIPRMRPLLPIHRNPPLRALGTRRRNKRLQPIPPLLATPPHDPQTRPPSLDHHRSTEHHPHLQSTQRRHLQNRPTRPTHPRLNPRTTPNPPSTATPSRLSVFLWELLQWFGGLQGEVEGNSWGSRGHSELAVLAFDHVGKGLPIRKVVLMKSSS